MNKLIPLIAFAILESSALRAQDEGAVVKRERIQRDKSIFLGGGASIVGGSNFGDYSTGINFEGGYIKRLNRVLSFGGSISYLRFNYDPSILLQPPPIYQDRLNFFVGYDANSNTIGALMFLSGGDLRLISLSANIKLNFIPVKDNSVLSIYGFAKPFITASTRSNVSIRQENYSLNTATNAWDRVNPDTHGNHSGETKLSGGIMIGPGVELYPGKKFSFYAQASFGYTFPIDVVSTRSYDNNLNSPIGNPKFPVGSIGFTSINFAAGISYNID